MKEQFTEVLPEEAKAWVKEHKPDTSKKGGNLAEDFRHARKKELWSLQRAPSLRRLQNVVTGVEELGT